MEEIETNCAICLGAIDDSFCILNCNCKNSFFHLNCINKWFEIKKQCPLCKFNFHPKPTFSKNYSGSPPLGPIPMFTLNWNILRILSGMPGLHYSS